MRTATQTKVDKAACVAMIEAHKKLAQERTVVCPHCGEAIPWNERAGHTCYTRYMRERYGAE